MRCRILGFASLLLAVILLAGSGSKLQPLSDGGPLVAKDGGSIPLCPPTLNATLGPGECKQKKPALVTSN